MGSKEHVAVDGLGAYWLKRMWDGLQNGLEIADEGNEVVKGVEHMTSQGLITMRRLTGLNLA